MRWLYRRRFSLIQGIQHIQHRLLKIRTDIEAKIDIAIPRPDIRRHLHHTRHLSKRSLLRLHNTGLDFLWCSIPPGGIDIDLWILEVRQHLNRQRRNPHHTQHKQKNSRRQ